MPVYDSLKSLTDECPRITGTAIGLIVAIVLLILLVCSSFSSSFFMRTKLCNYFSPCATETTDTVEAYKNIDGRYRRH
jgi:hypothetical protein